MKTKEQKQKYITTQEMRSDLQIAPTTCRAMIKSGMIPAIRFGTGEKREHFKVLRCDFEKYMKEASTRK
jgi:excisionase family DNA binding protein